MDARANTEAKKRSLLKQLERSLLDALAESADVHRALWQLQRSGYTLSLWLDCRESSAPKVASPTQSPESSQTTFRIDAGDLDFLRSIGIDPTRKPRARRKP